MFKSSTEEELFELHPGQTPLYNTLVYRKSHKSVNQNTITNDNRRVYEFKEFLSIGANKVIRYSKNIAPDTRDYTAALISRGATILPNGSIDVSTVFKGITEYQKTNGLISKKGNSNIRNSIDWFVLLAKEKTSLNQSTGTFYKWKCNFITLTLSGKQFHSDAELKKKLLQPMLNTLRQKYGVVNYLWRAESQSKGNIHFHILLDKWIPWKELRDLWNHYQNNLGYIDKFEKSFNHRNPNSTDVHSLQSIRNIAKYLSKYCGKNAKGVTIFSHLALKSKYNFPMLLINYVPRKIKKTDKFFRVIFGKLWGLSEQLSKLKKCRMTVTPAVDAEIIHFVKHYSHKIIDSDYCSTYLIGAKELVQHGFREVRDFLAKFVNNIIHPNPQLNLL